MAKINFNDLYINRDDGSLWTEQIFKAQYNHYKGEDEAWSKPYEEWKEWFVDGADGMPFVSLEQFLENNWFGISNSIEEAHSGFIGLFQNGESKSEIFLNFVCMFNDLDQYFADTLYLDVEDIRGNSPVDFERMSEVLKDVEHHYYEKFPNVDEAYLIVDTNEKTVKCIWNNFDVDTGLSSMDIYSFTFHSLVKRALSEKKLEYAHLIDGIYSADKIEEVVDLWKVDSIITKDAILIHDGSLYNHILLKDVIEQIPKQEFRKTKNSILEEQGKTLDYWDFGKIIRDKVDEAIDGEEYCWYVMNKSDYSDDDWKEFEKDLETLTPEQRQCIEFGDDPTVSFLGDFIKLFEEDQWLLENNIYQYWCQNEMDCGKEFKDTEFAFKIGNDSAFKKMTVQSFIKDCASDLGYSHDVQFYDNGIVLNLKQTGESQYIHFRSTSDCLKFLDNMVKHSLVENFDYKVDFIAYALSLEKEKDHFVLNRSDMAQSNESDRAILLHNVINQLETSQDLLREYLKEDNLVFEGSLSEIECQIEDIDRSIDGLYDLADDLNLDLNSFKEKNGFEKE